MYDLVSKWVFGTGAATGFINAVSSLGPHFGNERPDSEWIFRGHGDASYLLLPTAFRIENERRLYDLAAWNGVIPEFKQGKNVGQALAEARVLLLLHYELDKYAFSIPDDSPRLRKRLQETENTLASCGTQGTLPRWPDEELHSLMALAQHNQLPTRLLDWTRSGFVAAYFAAKSAIKKKADGWASVWALDSSPRRYVAALGLAGDARIQRISAPRSSNPNLHAQDGLFTLYLPNDPQSLDKVDRRPLNLIFDDIGSKYIILEHAPLMYHFEFSNTLAGEILWLLAKEGITAAKLFPNHGGVVEAIEERRLWKEPTNNERGRTKS